MIPSKFISSRAAAFKKREVSQCQDSLSFYGICDFVSCSVSYTKQITLNIKYQLVETYKAMKCSLIGVVSFLSVSTWFVVPILSLIDVTVCTYHFASAALM